MLNIKWLVTAVLVSIFVSGCARDNTELYAKLDYWMQNPPIAEKKTSSNGTVTIKYQDMSKTLSSVVLGVLQQPNEAREWAKVFAPIIGSVGTTWITQYYSTERNEDMWDGLSVFAEEIGDSYTAGGNIVTVDKGDYTVEPEE